VSLPQFRQDRLAHWKPNHLIPRSRDPLLEVPREGWPEDSSALDPSLTGVWRSHAFLVQRREYFGTVTLAVQRTKVGADRRWLAGITWDDLQWVKAQCGYADACAVEVFPPERFVINGTNVRHIHILSEIPAYCWTDGTK
jgi:hypothetical protein